MLFLPFSCFIAATGFAVNTYAQIGVVVVSNQLPAESAPDNRPVPFGLQPITGGNTRTDYTFIDGLGIDTFSANPHTLSVTQNLNPSASPAFVTALDPSTSALGGPWVALTTYSYIIAFEAGATADDMSMKIEAPYSGDQLAAAGVTEDNTFLGKFDASRGGWVIDVQRTNVHRVENRTRLIGLTTPAGEYMLLARASTISNDPDNTFLQFGQEISDGLFNVSAPPTALSACSDPSKMPLQIGTWLDGTRVMLRSTAGMVVGLNVNNISSGALPPGFKAASPYSYLINSTVTNAAVQMTLQMPVVPSQIQAASIDPFALAIAGRPLNSAFPYQLLSDTTIVAGGTGAIMNSATNSVQGEFVLVGKVTPQSETDRQRQQGKTLQQIVQFNQGRQFWGSSFGSQGCQAVGFSETACCTAVAH